MDTKSNEDVGASPGGGKTFGSNKIFVAFCQMFTFFGPKSRNFEQFWIQIEEDAREEDKIHFLAGNTEDGNE